MAKENISFRATEFKVGDIVKCVEGFQCGLIAGDDYVVRRVYPQAKTLDVGLVGDDNSWLGNWYASRFELKRREQVSEIRGPHDFQIGDMAYCIKNHMHASVGDIRKVTGLYGDAKLNCGDTAGTPIAADHYLRVLEKGERLPEGSKVMAMRFITGFNKGQVYPATYNVPSLAFALYSLPEPEVNQELIDARNLVHEAETKLKAAKELLDKANG